MAWRRASLASAWDLRFVSVHGALGGGVGGFGGAALGAAVGEAGFIGLQLELF